MNFIYAASFVVIIVSTTCIKYNDNLKCYSHEELIWKQNSYYKKYAIYYYKLIDLFYSKIYISSSVWCSFELSGLRCKFHNLIYSAQDNAFIFSLTPSSIVWGINSLLELSQKLYLSSVKNHNAMKLLVSTTTYPYLNKKLSYFIDDKVLIFTKFKPDNIFHIFHDDLLPLYFTLREVSIDDCNSDFILVPYNSSTENDKLYSFLFKNINYLQTKSNIFYCLKHAYAGLSTFSLWYDYGYSSEQRSIENLVLNENHLDMFKDCFINKFSLKPVTKSFGLLLSRKSTRKILNEDDIVSVLNNLQYFPPVKVISLEENGLFDVIQHLLSAEFIIGMHGASLILGIFLSRGKLLIELWPYALEPSVSTMYKVMCDINKINYYSWENKDISNSFINSKPLSIELKNKLSKVITKNECCDKSDWLLRMSQDTVIHVYKGKNFASSLLQDLLHKVYNKQYVSSSNLNERNYILYKISKISCNLYRKDNMTQMLLKWEEPFNIKYLSCASVNYEIIFSYNFKDPVRFTSSEKHFLKRYAGNVNAVNIWLTAICDNTYGIETFIYCTL